MTKQEACIKAGSASKLAQLLGISRPAVSQWKEIPSGRLFQLKVLRPEWFI